MKGQNSGYQYSPKFTTVGSKIFWLPVSMVWLGFLMPLKRCFLKLRCNYALSTWSETRLLLCLSNSVSRFVLTSRRFMLRQRNRRQSLTSNSLPKSGTSNTHRSPSLGAVTGRILSPSLPSPLRFAGRFIPPMLLSRWIVACGRWLSLNRFSPMMRLLSSWFIWRCGTSPKSGQCRFGIGSLLSIALRSSKRIASKSSS